MLQTTNLLFPNHPTNSHLMSFSLSQTIDRDVNKEYSTKCHHIYRLRPRSAWRFYLANLLLTIITSKRRVTFLELDLWPKTHLKSENGDFTPHPTLTSLSPAPLAHQIGLPGWNLLPVFAIRHCSAYQFLPITPAPCDRSPSAKRNDAVAISGMQIYVSMASYINAMSVVLLISLLNASI